MWTAQLAHRQAVLPAFLLGLAVAPVFQRNPEQHKRFRVVAFSFLTPFFFLKGGLSVNVTALLGAIPLLLGFFAVKIAAKFVGVLPVSLRFVRPHAMYTTLLMSTGLTFGTISSLYGLNAGIIDRAQFSVLITTVILSAVVPTFFAQRFFSPPTHALSTEEEVEVEDEEFAPGRAAGGQFSSSGGGVPPRRRISSSSSWRVSGSDISFSCISSAERRISGSDINRSDIAWKRDVMSFIAVSCATWIRIGWLAAAATASACTRTISMPLQPRHSPFRPQWQSCGRSRSSAA
jgi:Sodium/hydrogen exchanger family